nr:MULTISPECIES: PsiF family protein [Methylobacillus]
MSANPQASSNTQQLKMKTCNTEASSKKLEGNERKTFMQSCLSSSK